MCISSFYVVSLAAHSEQILGLLNNNFQVTMMHLRQSGVRMTFLHLRRLGLLTIATLLLLAGKLTAQTPEWTSIATDPERDGMYSGVLDGKELWYWYDQDLDNIVFKVDVYGTIDPNTIGINIVMNIPGDPTVASWWGANSSFRFNRLVTLWITGTPPSDYSGTVGICNAAGAQAMNYMNLARGNIGIAVQPGTSSYVFSFPREDLISDELLEAGPVNISAIAAVGTNQFWNDDIPDNGSGMMVLEKAEEEMFPDIQLSNSALNFDQTNVGDRTDRTFTISNTGEAILLVEDMAIEGDGVDQFSLIDSAPFEIEVGESRQVTVSFLPQGEGEFDAKILIVSNVPAPGNVQEITLSGTGAVEEIDPPAITLLAATMDFGSLMAGESRTQSFEVFNTGGSTLIVNNITIRGEGSEFFTLDSPAQFTVEPANSAQVSITFAPTIAIETLSEVVIESNAPEPDNSVVLSMTGVGLVETGVRPELIVENNFAVYPNPAHNDVNISCSLKTGGDVTLRIFDQRGRVLHTAPLGYRAPGEFNHRLNLDEANLTGAMLLLQLDIDHKPAATVTFMVH